MTETFEEVAFKLRSEAGVGLEGAEMRMFQMEEQQLQRSWGKGQLGVS